MNCDSMFPQIFSINKQHCWIQTNDCAHSINFRYSITVIKKIAKKRGEGEKNIWKSKFPDGYSCTFPSNRKFLIPRWKVYWTNAGKVFSTVSTLFSGSFVTLLTLHPLLIRLSVYIQALNFGWEPDMVRTDPSTSSQLDGYLYIANAHPPLLASGP